MMDIQNWRDVAKEMDDCTYLFLRWIGEPKDNHLRLIIEEASPQSHRTWIPPIESSPEIADILAGASPIESDSKSRLFEVSYEDYISYTVMNESYGKFPEPPELFTGKLFREFQWSYLLEWTRKVSYASDDHPGPGILQHHEIACLNHVIDVITTRPPNLTLIERENSTEPQLLH